MASSQASNKQWVYVQRPQGEVTADNYKLVTDTPIPEPQAGELLVRALYITVDPYLRIQQSALNTWSSPHVLNTVQQAGVVAEVIRSLDSTGNIKEGDIVLAYTGWQLYATTPANQVSKVDPSRPLSYYLGILGMPGRTAYFGLLDCGKPKAGETLVVSGAAGAVGNLVVQFGKIIGLRVVALAGGPEKVNFLKNIGADVALDYKKYKTKEEYVSVLRESCPTGIDIYFDNVGGTLTDAVFDLINLRARILVCGQISQYNSGLDVPELGPRFLHKVLYSRATIQGFLASDYVDRMQTMLDQVLPWLDQGKLKAFETIVSGFENLPSALNSLFHGKNIGKLVVKI